MEREALLSVRSRVEHEVVWPEAGGMFVPEKIVTKHKNAVASAISGCRRIKVCSTWLCVSNQFSQDVTECNAEQQRDGDDPIVQYIFGISTLYCYDRGHIADPVDQP